MPNARMMIHQPVRTGGGASNAKQLAISAASIERSRKTLVEILAFRCGKTEEEMSAILEYDHVCDAHEAIALGLIDKVAVPGTLVPPNNMWSGGGAGGAGSSSAAQPAAAHPPEPAPVLAPALGSTPASLTPAGTPLCMPCPCPCPCPCP